LRERITPIVLFYAFIIQPPLIFTKIKTLQKVLRNEGWNRKEKEIETSPPHIFHQRPTVSFVTATFCQKFARKRERMDTNKIKGKIILMNRCGGVFLFIFNWLYSNC